MAKSLHPADYSKTKIGRMGLGPLVDLCGLMKAKQADLDALEERIKDEFKKRGVTVAEGALFRVTLSPVDREVLDKEKVVGEAIRAGLTTEATKASWLATVTKDVSYIMLRCAARLAA